MSLLFKSRQSGAQQHSVSFVQQILMFFTSHFRQCISALGEIIRTPLASFMTIAVLGISITLPATLYVLVENLSNISSDTSQAAEISVFIQSNASDADIQQLVRRLRTWPEIESLVLISADDALEEFRQLSGFGDAVNYLDENPLPNVLLVYPEQRYGSPAAAQTLLDKIVQQREVDSGKLDIEWLERLHAIMAVANELVTMISLLLFFAVILIVGNTIRLNIFNKRNEILVMKLVGATDSFIQRPFLYTGFWYGLLGGVIAWITVAFLLWWMSSSITDILSLYNQDFDLAGLSISTLFSMLGISVFMGLAGSTISVGRYVRQIEPK